MNLVIKITLKIAKFIFIKFECIKKKGACNSINVAIGALKGEYFNIGKSVFINDKSEIGSYVLINKGVTIENTKIGNFCSIASGVNIGSFNHNYEKISTHRFAYEKFYGFKITKPMSEIKECIIGDDVWIGINSIILPGVEIKRGSIVGAGSVVTKNIGEFEIWAGNPARYIKNRFDEEEINFLKEFKWEKFENKKIQEIIDLNLDVQKIKDANL